MEAGSKHKNNGGRSNEIFSKPIRYGDTGCYFFMNLYFLIQKRVEIWCTACTKHYPHSEDRLKVTKFSSGEFNKKLNTWKTVVLLVVFSNTK